MKPETIGKILNFLKEKEGKEYPMNWNLIERLETHPDGIQYKHVGALDLSYTRITKLPNDLYVGGSLFLKNTNITKLPDKLYVDRTLSLTGCVELTKLPDNLYVGRNLIIDNTPLAKKYTDEEIYKIVASTGGKINGTIVRLWKKIQ
jgi:hypothetical protein